MPDSSRQPNPNPTPDLPQQLLNSGILSRGDYERLFLDPDQAGAGGGAPRTDATRIARELQQQGLVTPHQAKAIAQGKIEELKKFGSYVVLDVLGKGGMGRVYKARHPLLKRTVAIKTILASAFEDEETTRRFENEMEALGRISHPNVVAAQFAERLADGSYYLVMDYVEGADLFTLVRGDGKTASRPLDWRKACDYVIQTARGLAEAHKLGIIHRDVKPNNLVLSKDGVVKVLDLGLARFADGGKSMTATGLPMGTPEYMAPEQWTDAKRVGPATDIYALGGVLYFLISGRHLFGHKSELQEKMWAHVHKPAPKLRDAQSSAPQRLEGVFQKMVAKKPEQRYRSMAEVIAALESVAKPQAPSPSPPPPPMPVSDPRSNPTSRVWVAIGCVAIAVAALAIGIWALGPELDRQVDSSANERNRLGKLDLKPTPPIKSQGATNPPASKPAKSQSPPKSDSGSISISDGKAEPKVETPPKPEPKKPQSPPTQEPSKKSTPPAPPAPPSFAESIGIKLVRIEPGRFQMGSSDEDVKRDERDFYNLKGKIEDEKPRHEVEITRPFWLAAHEVTVGQFRRFVEEEKYQTEAEKDGKGGYGYDEKGSYKQDPKFTWRSPGFDQTDDHPVVNVSWNDVVKFCEWLSKKSGRKFELPTEAEWEYACRAGSTSRYSFGDDPEGLAKVCNFFDASGKKKYPNFIGIAADDGFTFTAPVGKYTANQWGLHDMHGNVWEWCRDVYDDKYYGKSPSRDPVNLEASTKSDDASRRVIRGGSWSTVPGRVRSALRSRGSPELRYSDLGFRVASVQQP